MIALMGQGGHTTYNLKEFVLDSEDDLENLPVEGIPMGSYAFVISTSEVYMFNSNKEWIKI